MAKSEKTFRRQIVSKNFRLQAAVNWIRLFFHQGYWNSWWLFTYAWQWLRPVFGHRISANKLFQLSDIAVLRHYSYPLGKFNPEWFQRIFEPETLGIRVWEYGLLFHSINNFSGLNILDIGSGASLLPDYLASLGANVTSLDLPHPQELRPIPFNHRHIVGTMTKLPFTKNSFDLIINISAIEHLDSWPKTQKTVAEMFRVLKPGGKIFLTTDFYLPRQTTDNWPNSSPNKIQAAYPFSRLSDFLKEFSRHGGKLNFPQKFLPGQHYRGRYFTTTAFLLIK